MNYSPIKINEGINIHLINTNKFKTNIISVFLTKKLTRENVTKEALIPAVLRLGTANVKTQEELNKKLEDMYGADFNCGIEKRGDNHVLKFYIEAIEDEYALNGENIQKEVINLLLDIVFNPLVENSSFKKEYVDGEKENLKRIIESKIDNKSNYAYVRCIEEMYKNEPFGLYEYGYIEDLKNINENNLYEYYEEFLNNCKIDIFVSGNINEKEIEDTIKSNKNINKLLPRNPEFILDSKQDINNIKEQTAEEKMDVSQGKIVIGMSIKNNIDDAVLNVYNAILGGGANSKLFQNVREKASLAYTAGSRYIKSKNNIFIRCGIEIKNYEKTIEIIKEQLEDMKKGKFSEDDIKNAKELLIASFISIQDEQPREISYYMSQQLSKDTSDIETACKKIESVNKEQIIEAAENIMINTIFFLRN